MSYHRFFGSFALLSILLCLVPLLSILAETPASPTRDRSPLDDTFSLVDLEPDSTLTLPWTTISVTVSATFTDARVFDLHLWMDPARLQLLSVVPGAEPAFHLMPEQLIGNDLTLDGFFHPNFTGSTDIATLTFYVNPVLDDDTTMVRFVSGQGYSGTENNPVPIQFTGDTAIVFIEGTPPDPPTGLLIMRLNYPAYDDSILLMWHPVFYDSELDTLINPVYVIYREHPISNPGVLDSIGATPDTFFYDTSITSSPDTSSVVNASTFTVVARKTQP